MKIALSASFTSLLLVSSCNMLPGSLGQSSSNLGVVANDNHSALATSIVQTHQANSPPDSTVPPSLIRSEALRAAQSEMGELMEAAIETAVAGTMTHQLLHTPEIHEINNRNSTPMAAITSTNMPQREETNFPLPTSTMDITVAGVPHACLDPDATWYGEPVDGINTREGPGIEYRFVATLNRPDCLALKGVNGRRTWVYGAICIYQSDGTCLSTKTNVWASLSLLTVYGDTNEIAVMSHSTPNSP